MKFLEEYINESIVDNLFEKYNIKTNISLINESLKSNILMDLVKQITDEIKYQKEKGSYYTSPVFQKMFGRLYIQWDKVTDDSFEICERPKNSEEDKKVLKKRAEMEKRVRAIIKQESHFIALLRDPVSNKFKFFVDNWGDIVNILDGKRVTNGYTYRSVKNLTQAEKMEYVKSSDIYLLDTSKFSSHPIRSERYEAKMNSIDFKDEHQMRDIARQNLERYKEIIAANKIKKMSESDNNISEMVKEIIERSLEYSVKINSEIEKYADLVYPIADVLSRIYGEEHYSRGERFGSTGLLKVFASYIQNKKHGLDGNYKDMYKRDMEANLSRIKSLISTLEDKLDEIESKL